MTCPSCGKYHAGTELSPGMRSTVCSRCVWALSQGRQVPAVAGPKAGQTTRKKVADNR